MTDDNVNLEPLSPHCLMGHLDYSGVNCLKCPFFDACFDPIMDMLELAFFDFPLDPEE